jgi:hypothetical protein
MMLDSRLLTSASAVTENEGRVLGTITLLQLNVNCVIHSKPQAMRPDCHINL